MISKYSKLLISPQMSIPALVTFSAGCAVAAREPDVEEGPDVVDGDAGGLQDGPPHAHLPVLHAHRPHLASGRTVNLGTCWVCNMPLQK